MTHPGAEDYIKAVQHPATAFVDQRLMTARFELNPLLGIPVPATGTSAVVFKASIDGRPVALRFFTRDDVSTRERYTALQDFVIRNGLGGHVVAAQWIDDAIAIRGRTWPAVRMDWVDGRPLDQYVEDLVDRRDTTALGGLAVAWRDLIRRLQTARFAHGDLQHGNVLVDQSGTLRLVDLDSAWIEPFTGSAPAAEAGHRHYQPAGRRWGPWMDTFPGLVIYLSLLALARYGDPAQPWKALYIGDNMLFQQEDFQPPHRTTVWARVAEAGDPRLDLLANTLKSCCIPGWTASGDLEALLSAQPPWWQRTRAAAAAPQPRRLPPPPPIPVPSVFVGQPVRGQAGRSGPWWEATPVAATERARTGRRWLVIVAVIVLVLVALTVLGVITRTQP